LEDVLENEEERPCGAEEVDLAVAVRDWDAVDIGFDALLRTILQDTTSTGRAISGSG